MAKKMNLYEVLEFEKAWMVALKTKNIALAKKIVTKKNAETHFPGRHCVLTYLCFLGPDDPQLLHHCVQSGASVMTHVGDKTPLHFAATNGKHALVRALLDLGASVNQQTMVGKQTALDLTDDDKCIKTLLEAGGKFSQPCNKYWWTLFFSQTREASRVESIIVLGLKHCGSKTIGNNNRDVLRMVARCVWARRGRAWPGNESEEKK